MEKLKFGIEGVKKIYQHSLENPVYTPSFEQMYGAEYRKDGKPFDENKGPWPTVKDVDIKKIPAQFTLVKDDGIYILAATEKRLRGKDTLNFVVYAEGFDPRKEDVWEDCRRVMGGDDGSDYLPLDWMEQAIKNSEESGYPFMVIEVTKTSMKLVLRRRKSH